MRSLSADDIEAELSRAKVRLARALSCERGPAGAHSLAPHRDGDGTVVDVERSDGARAATSLLHRALQAEDRLHVLSLRRDVADILSRGADAAAGGGGEGGADSVGALEKATDVCTSLGILVLRHRRARTRGQGGRSGRFLKALADWYDSIRDSSRATAIRLFRARLRLIAPEYPSSEKASALISEALFIANPPSRDEMHSIARCLVELQVVNDAIILQSQMALQAEEHALLSEGDDEHDCPPQPPQLPPSWRLDVVDELCRPLAERLRFHFLEEQTGILNADDSGGPSLDNGNMLHREQSSKMGRLPEWLFRYLREVVENHSVHSLVMMKGVQPLIDSVTQSLGVRASMAEGEELDLENDEYNDDEENFSDTDVAPDFDTDQILQQLRREYHGHASTYFLREVARMARHALRAKSFFHHPDVVGTECRDRTIALKGIEQLFLFDSFLEETAKEGSCGGEAGHNRGVMSPTMLPPRMVDTFLSSDEVLMRWWMKEECDGVIDSLRRCASAKLSSHLRNDWDGGAVSDSNAVGNYVSDLHRKLYPPVSELFVALLHSAWSKSAIFLDHRSRQMYIANVIAPLCSENIDVIHAEASWLRKQLLSRSPAVSSVSSVSVLRSTNMPSDELLTSNTMEWTKLITGTHLSAQAVLQPRDRTKASPYIDPNCLELRSVGEAIERLRDAMVKDFTSSFVETIIMERAKLASYIMRTPFLLSEPPPDLPERRGQRDHDKRCDTLLLSPDLNDSIHAVSCALKACDTVMLEVVNTFQLGNAPPFDSMMYFGCQAVRGALIMAVSQKLLDIAIDPQGMTPEIYLAGARQFRHDTTCFTQLFRAASGDGIWKGGCIEQHGPMQRVDAASRLMSLEPPQLQAIREALGALVEPSSGIGSLFGMKTDISAAGGSVKDVDPVYRLDADDFYRDERLMEEAVNMLEAKGFGALALEEVLSIINRRC